MKIGGRPITFVIPAKAGIHLDLSCREKKGKMDSRLRGNDVQHGLVQRFRGMPDREVGSPLLKYNHECLSPCSPWFSLLIFGF